MSFILTFLGKGGVGCTTVAIAAAKKIASQGKRVLLASQDYSPAFSLLLGLPVSAEPQAVTEQFSVVQFQSSVLLERSWEELKRQEAKYLRTPFFKAVYGQELGVLPGMDNALALNALREYDASGKYDVIVYDGASDLSTLRMLGMPEILNWYVRRFRQVFSESDLAKAISPFIQPVASAVLNVNWGSGDLFDQPQANEMKGLLERGQAAVNNPSRVAAYLVTDDRPESIATARYLWGSAQQVGLTVGGVVLNRSQDSSVDFSPLPVTSLPERQSDDWENLVTALPNLEVAADIPRAVTVNVAERQVKLFLPGFDKKEIKLTQSGPEVTIEAGDQRRNVFLPPELSGQPVKGAKFQDSYLIISL